MWGRGTPLARHPLVGCCLYGSGSLCQSFLNRVGIAYTSLSATELIRHFKQIERALGRVSESKHLGIIPMDIDLLQWNDDLLKPDDLQRSYIKAGISQLSERCV